MSQSNSDLQTQPSEFLPARKSGADADARRSRLREFQSHLLERMQAARSGADTNQNQLGLLIGQQRWLLSLQEAGEIVAVDSITKVPLTRDWYLGLANIRGTLISVIDFARFQGQALTAIDKGSRIVAFAPALAFNSGLLVTRVLGLRNVGEMVLQPAPQAADDPGAARYLDSESQLWTELNLAQIVQDPRFLHVGV
jgi:twitching motility protein PilI